MKENIRLVIYKKHIAFLVIPALLLSCNKEITKFSEKDVFKYNEHSNIATLDPAFARKQADIWPIHQLYNGLVQLNENLKVEPAIAKNWKFLNNGKTVEFTLRSDVYFHKNIAFGIDSTRLVTAKDFEYSFNRLLNPKVASPGKWVLNNVKNFYAVNDSVFKIELKEAFPPFLGLLTMKYCSVVPKEAVEYYGNEFRSNPVGTGPFYKKLWVENTKLVLRKNPLYFEKENGKNLPYLEAVSITFLPDKQSEFLQFIQGNLDILSGIDASFKDEILTGTGNLKTKYVKRIKLQKAPYLNTEYLGFYMEVNPNYPTANIKIRKAVNYGFDRVKMMKFLRNGIGTPAVNGFIPKGLPSFNNLKGYTYQPEKAKKLVQEYIRETGNKNPKITITTDAQYLDLCEYIQQEMSNINIEVKIDVLPPSMLRQGKSKGELPVFRASWIADYPDAENYLSLYYSKFFTPNGSNYTHFKNTDFDNLYEKAIATVEPEKRYKIYQKMDSIIIDKAPVVPLYYDEVTMFSQKNIQNLKINAINLLELKRVNKK